MFFYLVTICWVLVLLDAMMAWNRERRIKPLCPKSGSYALVTGGSEGIGLEIARVLATKKWNLILVARNVKKLNKVASEFKEEFSIEIEILPMDLSVPGSGKELYNKVTNLRVNSDLRVELLVNNAGFGAFSNFAEEKITQIVAMVQLNILTLTELTHLFGKHMTERGRGRILNIGSVAGFAPIPLAAVYSAGKSYVNFFTRALAYEMNPHGVGVVNLCPGATKSQFAKRADMEESLLFKLPGFVQSSRAVAEEAVAHTLGAAPSCVCVTGRLNQIFAILNPMLPLSFAMQAGHVLFV